MFFVAGFEGERVMVWDGTCFAWRQKVSGAEILQNIQYGILSLYLQPPDIAGLPDLKSYYIVEVDTSDLLFAVENVGYACGLAERDNQDTELLIDDFTLRACAQEFETTICAITDDHDQVVEYLEEFGMKLVNEKRQSIDEWSFDLLDNPSLS